MLRVTQGRYIYNNIGSVKLPARIIIEGEFTLRVRYIAFPPTEYTYLTPAS